MKNLVLIAIGLAAGYSYGFRDAHEHDKTVVARLVERVGGSNRTNFGTDVDKQMRSAEQQ